MKSCILITYDNQDMVLEAKSLCEAAQYKILFTMKEDDLQFTKYGISEGKIPQLEEIIKKYQPDVIVFDEVLKPNQNYSLASKL